MLSQFDESSRRYPILPANRAMASAWRRIALWKAYEHRSHAESTISSSSAIARQSTLAPSSAKERSHSTWFEDGLSFSCTKCGACCTSGSSQAILGVHVNEQEQHNIAKYLAASIDDFRNRFLQSGCALHPYAFLPVPRPENQL